MPTFHALIIGINQYAPPISSLRGCVNDANAIENALQKYVDTQAYALQIQKLITAEGFVQPTRQHILTALESYVGKVQAEDIFFLFYAGHGSREKAHPDFRTSTGELSTLVPMDSGVVDKTSNRPIFDILSVELRALLYNIWKHAKAEIIFVQDSCHSEKSTRFFGQKSIELAREVNNHPNRAFARNLNELVPSVRAITQTAPAQKLTFEQAFPICPQVHFAACGEEQSAYEDSTDTIIHGYFTKYLLYLLAQNGGRVSYRELANRLRIGLEGQQFNQTPNLFVRSDNPSKAYSQFLGRACLREKNTYNVLPTLNPDTQTWGWVMDAGALQGLPLLKTGERLPVELIETNNQLKTQAFIEYVLPTRSLLSLSDANLPTKGEVRYVARMAESLKIRPERKLKVYIHPPAPIRPVLVNILALAQADSSALIQITKAEEADFWVKTDNQNIYLYDTLGKLCVTAAAYKSPEQADLIPARKLPAQDFWEKYDANGDLASLSAGSLPIPLTEADWLECFYGILDYLSKLPNPQNKIFKLATPENPDFKTFLQKEACVWIHTHADFVEDPKTAEVVIHSNEKGFVLTYANTQLPISQPFAEIDAPQLCEGLQTLARSKQLRFLYNPHPQKIATFEDISLSLTFKDRNFERFTNLTPPTVRTIFKTESPYYQPFKMHFLPTKSNPDIWLSDFELCLDYQYKGYLKGSDIPRIFVSVLLLGFDGEITALQPCSLFLPSQDPNRLPSVMTNLTQPLRIEAPFKAYPEAYRMGYLKVLVGFEHFDISPFLQYGLPRYLSDDMLNKELRGGSIRGKAADWNAFTLPFVYTF